MGLGAVLVALVAALVVAAPAGAYEPADPGRVADGVVPAQLARYRIPGAAVVVVAGGRQVYARGFGVADTARRTPVDPARTRFLVGSVGKVFTATAVAQLAAAGKIDMHADVNRYLRTFRIADTYPGRPVTMTDLLTHTSGFEDEFLGVATPDGRRPEALGRWLAAHQPKRIRPPGTLASYDNYGIALAGYVVEQVSGEPYAGYIARHVTGPLGMTGTRVDPPQDDLATGYRSDGTPATGGQYGPMSPAGAGVAATPTDLGRYLVDALRPGNPLLARHFTMDRRMPGMGLVFEEHPRDGLRILSKDGDVPGYHDNLALLPDLGIGVYVAYDGDGAGGQATFAGHDLVDRIADALHRTAPAPARPGGDLSRYAGDYRITRYNDDDITKLALVTSTVTVTAGSGDLTTTGLADDPDAGAQHWYPTGDGTFALRGGQDRIAFRDGVLLCSANPTQAFTRLAWWQEPDLHLAILGGSLLVLLYAVVAWPVAALARRRDGWAPLLARLAGWLTAATTLVAVGLLASVVADSAALNERLLLGDSGALDASLVLVRVVSGLAGLMLVAAVLAWVRRWWRLPGRIGYTVVAVAAGAFLGVGAVYNVL